MKKLLLVFMAVAYGVMLHAQCTDLFFSEYVEGSGTNKALEIYNPTNNTIDLSLYQLVRYSNGEITPNSVGLAGTIASNDVYVTVLEKLDPSGTGMDTMVSIVLQALADTFLCPVYSVNKMHYFNGNDAVTIELLNGTYLDIIGVIGEDPGEGWSSDTSAGFTTANGWWLAWTANHSMIRKPTVKDGIITNPLYFNPAAEWDTIGNNDFDSLGFHTCDCFPSTGVSSIEKKKDIFFFPNPVIGEDFMIKGNAIIHSAEFIDLMGRPVFYRENEAKRGDMKIKVNKFVTGIYLVRVTFDDMSQITRKIVVK